MAVNFVKTNIAKMAGVLEPEYPDWVTKAKALRKATKADEADPLEIEELEQLENTLAEIEEIALAALEAAQGIIAERAKFTVVGQVKQPDNKGDKVALGWYATEKQATSDALSLAYSAQTAEEARAWVIPVHHDTPFSWYKERKGKMIKEGEVLNYRQAELKRRQEWFSANETEPIPEDWSVVVVTKVDTDECSHCYGLGRIPKEDVKRMRDVPERHRSRRAAEVSTF